VIEQLLFLLTGAIAGSLAGLLGVGGGFIVVPCLNAILRNHFPSPLVPHIAVGTSFAIMIFTASSAAFAYYRRRLIEWDLFYQFMPGAVIGTLIGSIVARYIPGQTLLTAFSIFLIAVAINMLFSHQPKASHASYSLIPVIIISVIPGLCSGFFGVGGGTLMVPFFISCKIEVRKAAGTASLCGLPLAIIGTFSLIISGWANGAIHTTTDTTGYIYWPAVLTVALASLFFAPIGTRIAVWLPPKTLKKIFAIVLIITAIHLIK
jgi:uncharacterized protein